MFYGNAVVYDGGELSLDTVIDGGELSLSDLIEDGPGEFMPVLPAAYSGPTTVTPTRQAQVLETEGLVMGSNITVNPIPSNYGLITWNGATLTVS